MTKREHAEAWVQHLLDASTHGAAMTDATWDDGVVAKLHQAWAIPFVKGFILDRIEAFLGGDEAAALAMASPEVAEQLNVAGIGFGDISKFISTAITIFKLLKDVFGK